MILRPFLNDASSCASYLFGCTTHEQLAVVDPHADLVDAYVAASAASIGSPIVGGLRDPRAGGPRLRPAGAGQRTRRARRYLPAGAGR